LLHTSITFHLIIKEWSKLLFEMEVGVGKIIKKHWNNNEKTSHKDCGSIGKPMILY
jgi:hypothetical protein